MFLYDSFMKTEKTLCSNARKMNFQRLPTDSLRAPFRLRKIEDYLFGVDQFMNPNEKLRTLDLSKGLVHVLISVVLSGIVSSITTLDSGMITANLEAGATFGMDLVWVTFWGTLASVIFSITSMKLGLATEEDLAEHCTEEFPWVVSRIMFLAMKIIVISIDMAQLVGMAVGMNLIFSLPLAWGLGLTFLDFLLVKHLYDSKVKYFEIFIGFSIFGAGFLFFASFATIGLPWTEFFAGLVPQLGASKLGLCLCVLATTLAPQNLFLQANIVTSRQHEHSERVVKDIMFSTSLELVCSRFITWLSMLIIMTLSFQELYLNSETNTSTLEEGASMLRVLFTRPTASVIFGVLLVCTGIVGSTQATLSDHSATEKFLNTKIKPFKIHAYIRYISFIPTLMVAIYGGDAALYDQILYCLVLVSISTPLVLVSLTKFTSDEAKMGSFVNYTIVSMFMFFVSTALTVANAIWIISQASELADRGPLPGWLVLSVAVIFLMGYVGLYLYICIYDFDWFARYVTRSQWRRRFMLPTRFGYRGSESPGLFPLDTDDEDDFS